MSDMSVDLSTDMATGGSHGGANPLRIDHSSVLAYLMIGAVLLLGLIHFSFGVKFGVGR
jgi:hypothetical protein